MVVVVVVVVVVVAAAAAGCCCLLLNAGGYCMVLRVLAASSVAAAAAEAVCPVSRSCCFPVADLKDQSCGTGAEDAINCYLRFLPLLPLAAISRPC